MNRFQVTITLAAGIITAIPWLSEVTKSLEMVTGNSHVLCSAILTALNFITVLILLSKDLTNRSKVATFAWVFLALLLGSFAYYNYLFDTQVSKDGHLFPLFPQCQLSEALKNYGGIERVVVEYGEGLGNLMETSRISLLFTKGLFWLITAAMSISSICAVVLFASMNPPLPSRNV